MATVDTLSIAYQTAKNLAVILKSLGARLPLSQTEAAAVRSSVYLVSAVLAPAITSVTEVALIGAAIADSADAIADDAAARDAAPAFADAATSCATAAPSFTSPALTRARSLGAMLAACSESAFLGQSFVAEAKTSFLDQQSAIAARQRISDAMDGAIDRIAAAAGKDVIGLLMAVANTTSAHIASVAADLQPIIQVETLRSAPSTMLAYELYGDPSQAEDLVTRNRCGTPLFMPTTIKALAPADSL